MQFYQTRLERKPLITSSLHKLRRKENASGSEAEYLEKLLGGQGEPVAGMVRESYRLHGRFDWRTKTRNTSPRLFITAIEVNLY